MTARQWRGVVTAVAAVGGAGYGAAVWLARVARYAERVEDEGRPARPLVPAHG